MSSVNVETEVDRARLMDEKWELLTSFLTSSNSAIVITNDSSKDYSIVFANPAFEKLTGYSLDEVIGKNCRFLQNEDRRQSGRNRIISCLQKKIPCRSVLRNYTKEGKEFWNSISIFPLTIGGEVSHFASIQHDASSERIALDKLKAKSRERKKLVKELQGKRRKLQELSVDFINAQEAERQFIARELHDELGQRLAAVVMELDRARSVLPVADNEVFLTRIESEVKYLIRLVRDMNASLRQPGLAQFGLEKAIRELLRRQLAGVAAWALEFSYGGPGLPSIVEVSLFRIVQECLTNILRYAHASHVVVRVFEVGRGRKIMLRVMDNGIGFDSSNWSASHTKESKFGLVGMSERALLLGGDFNVKSVPNHGTIIEVIIPSVGEGFQSG